MHCWQSKPVTWVWLLLSSYSATTRTTPLTKISWISAVRIYTTSEEGGVGVKAALQSHGAGGGDCDCQSHFLSLRYCYMTDYGSHRALYVARSGIDALMLHKLGRGRILGPFM